MLQTRLSQARQTNVRWYSSKAPLTLQLIRDRVILVLKLYDKITPEKVKHLALLTEAVSAWLTLEKIFHSSFKQSENTKATNYGF